jgi:hypothetical protein
MYIPVFQLVFWVDRTNIKPALLVSKLAQQWRFGWWETTSHGRLINGSFIDLLAQ